MFLTFRWYGPSDPVTLPNIRQIPAVRGIVTALYDVPVGDVWPLDKLRARQQEIESAGLRFEVVESIPVPEAVKLGLPERDHLIANFQQSIRHMGQIGVHVLCYNFMPVFDWTRTNLAMRRPDGSTALIYRDADLQKIDLSQGTAGLPGWANAFTADELQPLLRQYRAVDEEALFQNVAYFLKAVIPVAQESDVYLALHPDDPPWPIFGLPRIARDETTLQRILDAVDSPHNGLTFCTGSLGASSQNDLPKMIRRFAGRINFVHARNVKRSGEKDFDEVEHPSAFGDVDMHAVLSALIETGFNGPVRPDHGRMIWGEQGRPGYGLYDRALGAMYLYGLMEGIERTRPNEA
jgi:mannonate dehydratase